MVSSVTSSLTQRRPTSTAKTTNDEAAVQTKNNKTTSASIANNDKPFRLIDWLGGIGGTVNFSFFQAPSWVDLKLPPGTTSQEVMALSHPKLWSLVSGHYILYSPNLVWFTVALLIYILAPYDIEGTDAANHSRWKSLGWFQNRLLLNTSVMLAYYGFWHTVLYGLGWAKRPFAQGRVYRFSKLLHNLYYCFLGILQWTAWEMIMIHLYATNRIGYQRDDQIFASLKDFANFFFGICMSPAEHIYYISSVAPSLYWHASPFLFLWNGIHLILSPGASHSGWEDHWHSDQFHVAHHRYFECNYGTPGMPFDRWFGCFRETLASQTKVYHGDAVECKSQQGSTAITARPDPKANLWGLPSWDQIIYHVAIALGIPLLVYNAVIHRDTLGNKVPFWYQAPVTAFLVSMGPLILAVVLSFVTASSSTIANLESFRNTMLYPFHKEALFGKFGISLVLGTLCSLIPVYHFIHTLLVQDPQDAIYHRIWGTAKLHSY